MQCKQDAVQSVENENAAKDSLQKAGQSESKVLSNYQRVRSDGLAGITVCGELDSSDDSSVIKIASLILCTHMDIFIAVLIDYTCTTSLIDQAKSSLM